jgi:hypothetical protein
MLASFLALAAAATLEVAPGESLSAALARAKPGDEVRLAAGTFAGSLGRQKRLRVVGVDPAETIIEAPEGEDGLVAEESVELAHLTLVGAAGKAGLKVLAGEAKLEDVVLHGGSTGAFVGRDARLTARQTSFSGGLYGLLVDKGSASVASGQARGGRAGVAMNTGTVELSRFEIAGPSKDAALSVGSGKATLHDVVMMQPGPSGISVSFGGELVGDGVVIAGVLAENDMGDCVQALKAKVTLSDALLEKCLGAALSSSGGEIRLDGVDAVGGSAGCLVLLDGSKAALQGVRCAGHGPGLVAMSGTRALLRMNRWLAGEMLFVECATSEVKLLYGEEERAPCQPPPAKAPTPGKGR